METLLKNDCCQIVIREGYLHIKMIRRRFMSNNNEAQVFNPFLPIDEYIPDGEPHVFGDRVYLYGSHDKEGGETFCMLDYTVYSAPVTDLKNWRKEGVIYRATQDPDYNERQYMYAPDVVRGNDGRYYLYYCMSGPFGHGGYFGPIRVAVCDTPAGEFEYLGFVKNKNGEPAQDFVCFDPGVINDNGSIYLYSGTQYPFEEEPDFFENEEHIQSEMTMFNRSREVILDKAKCGSVMGPIVMELEDDMLTLKAPAKHLIPYAVKGTSFEEHPFFEASSMRKVGDKYYFIYSSMQNHELCYATSDYPDRGFTFGGTIVSNGDVGFEGRKLEDKLNMTGTTHGSIECINGEWYVFYHRLTHKSDYSRQACAQKIKFEEDGSIKQVEITSCGLNGGPLRAEGSYPAVICCNLTNGHMPHGCNKIYTDCFPNVNNEGVDRFISEISDGTLIGYKYFDIKDNKEFKIMYRGDAEGKLDIMTKPDGDVIGSFDITKCDTWTMCTAQAAFTCGETAIFLKFHGSGLFEIKEIAF